MKKISFLVVFVITLFKVCYAQTSQWDVYNSIPSFKKIEIIFNKNDSYSEERIENFFDNGFHKHNTTPPRLFINDDYTVTMAYVIPLVPDWSHYTSQNLAISGNGVLLWQNDHMVLHLHITEKTPGCSFSYETQVYAGEDFFGFDVYHPGHIDFKIPSYEKTYNYNYDVYYDEQNDHLILSGNNICSKVTGNLARVDEKTYSTRNYTIFFNAYITINKSFSYKIEAKSESELNAENSDIYGKWQWNEDRSKIYLSSMTDHSYMVLWNNKNNLEWGFTLPDSSCGYKTEETAKGENLEYLMISFDGSSEQSFIFNTYYYDIMQFDDSSEGSSSIDSGYFYENVQYDRFSGKLKRNASILGQIKDKRIMVVNYKQNGLDKTAMFQLEGLEAIYNALTEEDE
ncbi:MAG: hypothetical protein IJK92_08365 [Bacteroidales bacterium]|nr:hypothetical protein [Bacteroidales bacterium]